jgi:hypothetical protein
MSVLRRVNISTSNNLQSVLSFIVSKDRRFLLVGCGEGGLTVITEPFTDSTPSSRTSQKRTVSAKESEGSHKKLPGLQGYKGRPLIL